MPILFSAVACASEIVANFASCDGNFMEIAEQVLPKLPASNKMTYSHGIYLIHYIAEDNYTYFCITDKLCQRSRSFLFLNEIQRRYIEDKMNFTTVLAAEMYRYSEDYSTINIRKGELDELNNIGVGCSESILGEKILYINNPENISYSTISYEDAPERISVSSMTAERISESVVTPETLSQPILTSERILESVLTPEIISETEVISEIMSESELISEIISESVSNAKIISESKLISESVLNPERISDSFANAKRISESIVTPKIISELAIHPDKMSKSTVTPRLYVVIIGMMILVIAMAVYAFGPISCAVVTSVGIYSLFCSFVSSKDKSDQSDAKE